MTKQFQINYNNIVWFEFNKAALHIAVENKNIEIVKYLSNDPNIDINAQMILIYFQRITN